MGKGTSTRTISKMRLRGWSVCRRRWRAGVIICRRIVGRRSGLGRGRGRGGNCARGGDGLWVVALPHGWLSRILKSMEVHFTPETEKKLQDLASRSGSGTADKLVQDVADGYLDEPPQTRG